ncbi:MAG: hypothetical protein ACFHHU_04535 [Porticoccaceae bacterium]
MAENKRPPLTGPTLKLTDEQDKILLEQIRTFRGQGTTLESAIGALVVGQHMGWRVLRIIHSPTTYKKYEKILGLKFQDLCPETTNHSTRNSGFKIVEKLGAFWDVVMGRKKVDNKGYFENE